MKKEAIQTFSYRIAQASRSDLVVILYDIACEYIDDALAEDCSCGNTTEKQMEAIRNCGRVIDLLIKGLNFQYEISNQLFQIYLYLKRELIKCMAHKDKEKLAHIKELIGKLRTSFYEVSKTDTSGPLMKNSQQIYSGLTYSSIGSSNEMAEVVTNRGFTV